MDLLRPVFVANRRPKAELLEVAIVFIISRNSIGLSPTGKNISFLGRTLHINCLGCLPACISPVALDHNRPGTIGNLAPIATAVGGSGCQGPAACSGERTVCQLFFAALANAGRPQRPVVGLVCAASS